MKQLEALLAVTEQMQLVRVPASAGARSQNYRMVAVGRDPPRSPGPDPCPKEGQREQVGQGHIHLGFEYLKDGDSETSPGNLYKLTVICK